MRNEFYERPIKKLRVHFLGRSVRQPKLSTLFVFVSQYLLITSLLCKETIGFLYHQMNMFILFKRNVHIAWDMGCLSKFGLQMLERLWTRDLTETSVGVNYEIGMFSVDKLMEDAPSRRSRCRGLQGTVRLFQRPLLYDFRRRISFYCIYSTVISLIGSIISNSTIGSVSSNEM